MLPSSGPLPRNLLAASCDAITGIEWPRGVSCPADRCAGGHHRDQDQGRRTHADAGVLGAVRKAADTTEKLALAQKLATRRLANGVLPELDACFAALHLETVAAPLSAV